MNGVEPILYEVLDLPINFGRAFADLVYLAEQITLYDQLVCESLRHVSRAPPTRAPLASPATCAGAPACARAGNSVGGGVGQLRPHGPRVPAVPRRPPCRSVPPARLRSAATPPAVARRVLHPRKASGLRPS